MANQEDKKEKKGVAWYIPPALRHWLNSHSEYLSAIGKEISTDAMVVEWLIERVKIEEKKRDALKLERAVEEKEQEEGMLNFTHENGKESVRRSPPPDAEKPTTKNIRDKGGKKGRTKT